VPSKVELHKHNSYYLELENPFGRVGQGHFQVVSELKG